jgi:putative FmdB family regulatory protein
MPIYDYECEQCFLRFELKKLFGEDGEASCPQCGSNSKRLFSSVPIIFKGPGFYVNDSKQNKLPAEDSVGKI